MHSIASYFTLPLQNPVLIFAVVLLIILFAPIIFTKLRIPYIVGLIVAGIIVGPNGFNILLHDSSIELFGTVGLLYIMFLAGVEVDIEDFKNNRVKSIGFGLYAFTIAMAIGIVLALYVLHYDLMTSILLASMFSSHTLLAYPIVSRYGITKIRSVSITVIGTIITDTLSLLTLAVIAGSHEGTLDALHWVQFVGLFLLFGVVVLFGFPWLTRQFFKRNTDSVAQYIFVLALLFVAAFGAQLIGMEGIIGAFLAGIALNRLIPSTSALMNRIDFVGNAIFIPFFLISVGMIVDVRVFFKGPNALIVAATMAIGAMVAKYLAAWATQKTFKLRADERNLIFGLSNAHAAAALAVVVVGRRIGLFNDDVLNGTVVMILVTCIVSSFATERAARKIASQTKLHANTGRKNGKILIPVSNPATIERLVEFATMIRSEKSKEPLYALYISDKQDVSEDRWKHGERILEKAASFASASDTELEMLHLAHNSIAKGIIKAINSQQITDVVLGLHQSTNLVKAMFAMRLNTLLKGSKQSIFVSQLHQPLNTIKRIRVAVPALAEYEAGFARWLYRLGNLQKQINVPLIFYANRNTLNQIEALNQKSETAYDIQLIEFDIRTGFRALVHEVHKDDLFVAVGARMSSVSYAPIIERLYDILTNHFSHSNLLIIYPEPYGSDEEQNKFLSGGKKI